MRSQIKFFSLVISSLAVASSYTFPVAANVPVTQPSDEKEVLFIW